MADNKKQPERGVGSNQYADKPPRSLSEEDVRKRQRAAGSSAEAVQSLAALDSDISEKFDSYIQDPSSVRQDRYSSFINHPANPYFHETTGGSRGERAAQEWLSMYPANTGRGKIRQWNPVGEITIGYAASTPLGEPEFLVSVSNVSPPKDLLRAYGIDEHAALRYAEDDRIIVDGAGNFEDANSIEAPLDLPAVPFTFLPAETQDRIKEIVNYHIQFGKVWEATYNEQTDEWTLLVKYGSCFKEETWPKREVSSVDERQERAVEYDVNEEDGFDDSGGSASNFRTL